MSPAGKAAPPKVESSSDDAHAATFGQWAARPELDSFADPEIAVFVGRGGKMVATATVPRSTYRDMKNQPVHSGDAPFFEVASS